MKAPFEARRSPCVCKNVDEFVISYVMYCNTYDQTYITGFGAVQGIVREMYGPDARLEDSKVEGVRGQIDAMDDIHYASRTGRRVSKNWAYLVLKMSFSEEGR